MGRGQALRGQTGGLWGEDGPRLRQAARRLREGPFQQHRDLPHVGGAQRQGLRAQRRVCEEEEHLHEQELRRDGGGPRHAEHTRGQLCGTVCGETEGAAQRGLGGGGVSPYQSLQGRPRPVLELRGDEDPHAHPLHRHAGAGGQRRAEKDLPAGLPIQKGRRDRHGRLAREPSAAGPLRRDGRPIRQGKGPGRGPRPHQPNLRIGDDRAGGAAVHPPGGRGKSRRLRRRHQARIQEPQPHHKVV